MEWSGELKKKDKEYLDRVAELGCIVCRNERLGKSPALIHHIRTGYGVSQRAPHHEAIPLCPIHHQYPAGGELAYHASPKQFEDRYGTELELLEQVRGLLLK
jgi:hypothetical protein